MDDFHFLAAPAPACASNCVHVSSRPPGGRAAHSAQSHSTRWRPSRKVPRLSPHTTGSCARGARPGAPQRAGRGALLGLEGPRAGRATSRSWLAARADGVTPRCLADMRPTRMPSTVCAVLERVQALHLWSTAPLFQQASIRHRARATARPRPHATSPGALPVRAPPRRPRQSPHRTAPPPARRRRRRRRRHRRRRAWLWHGFCAPAAAGCRRRTTSRTRRRACGRSGGRGTLPRGTGGSACARLRLRCRAAGRHARLCRGAERGVGRAPRACYSRQTSTQTKNYEIGELPLSSAPRPEQGAAPVTRTTPQAG